MEGEGEKAANGVASQDGVSVDCRFMSASFFVLTHSRQIFDPADAAALLSHGH